MERLRAKANFWAEIDGQVVLSEWRIQLLQAVGQAGSISGAAETLGISYKLAWERLREMEERLDRSLIQTQVGGVGGGGATLTGEARDYIQRWDAFMDGLHDLINQRFEAAFDQ